MFPVILPIDGHSISYWTMNPKASKGQGLLKSHVSSIFMQVIYARLLMKSPWIPTPISAKTRGASRLLWLSNSPDLSMKATDVVYPGRKQLLQPLSIASQNFGLFIYSNLAVSWLEEETTARLLGCCRWCCWLWRHPQHLFSALIGIVDLIFQPGSVFWHGSVLDKKLKSHFNLQ